MSATSLASKSREPQENGGGSPEEGGVLLHDGEIFQLELDALLPASRRSADHCVKVDPPATQGDSEFQANFLRPTSEPVPLSRPPRPAPYVVMPLTMGPQDCWGNLLGKSRR